MCAPTQSNLLRSNPLTHLSNYGVDDSRATIDIPERTLPHSVARNRPRWPGRLRTHSRRRRKRKRPRRLPRPPPAAPPPHRTTPSSSIFNSRPAILSSPVHPHAPNSSASALPAAATATGFARLAASVRDGDPSARYPRHRHGVAVLGDRHRVVVLRGLRVAVLDDGRVVVLRGVIFRYGPLDGNPSAVRVSSRRRGNDRRDGFRGGAVAFSQPPSRRADTCTAFRLFGTGIRESDERFCLVSRGGRGWGRVNSTRGGGGDGVA